MSISYKRLWKKLIDLEISKSDFKEKANLSSRAMTSMNKGEPVHLTVIEKICTTLDCSIEEIIEIIPDK